jgi:hypothetical protein
MLHAGFFESAICQVFVRVDTCSPRNSTIDHPAIHGTRCLQQLTPLHREGTVTRQRPDSSDYILSLTPSRTVETGRLMPAHRATNMVSIQYGDLGVGMGTGRALLGNLGMKRYGVSFDDLHEQFDTEKSCHATCRVGSVRIVSALWMPPFQRASSN